MDSWFNLVSGSWSDLVSELWINLVSGSWINLVSEPWINLVLESWFNLVLDSWFGLVSEPNTDAILVSKSFLVSVKLSRSLSNPWITLKLKSAKVGFVSESDPVSDPELGSECIINLFNSEIISGSILSSKFLSVDLSEVSSDFNLVLLRISSGFSLFFSIIKSSFKSNSFLKLELLELSSE